MGKKKTSKKAKDEVIEDENIKALNSEKPKIQAKTPKKTSQSKKSTHKGVKNDELFDLEDEIEIIDENLNQDIQVKKKITKKQKGKGKSKKIGDFDENRKPIDENLQKLLTPEERDKMEENLDLVVCYLEDIGIVDLKIDREKLIIAVPFDYEDFTFLSHIVLSPEWILIKTSIFEIEKLTESSVFNLFAEVLKGNFILNSVVYSLDPENKSIWAQADVPITADFDTFKLNYFSIVFAIDYFMKNVSPKLQMQLKSTVEKEEFKHDPNTLYI